MFLPEKENSQPIPIEINFKWKKNEPSQLPGPVPV